MQAVQAAAAAIGTSGHSSLEILQQVLSTFGEIRCCDIPSLDPFRSSTNTLGNSGPLSQDTTFDAYVQFSEYIGFVKAMDACRNMKLMLVDESNVAFTASIKVKTWPIVIHCRCDRSMFDRWISIVHDIYRIE
jgi:hypothetical protein